MGNVRSARKSIIKWTRLGYNGKRSGPNGECDHTASFNGLLLWVATGPGRTRWYIARDDSVDAPAVGEGYVSHGDERITGKRTAVTVAKLDAETEARAFLQRNKR